MARFIGRQQELARLLETTRKSSASFVVVRGRRRVGKSRLIEEFSHHFDHYHIFTGLAPDKDTTAEHQLKEFSRQMARQFNTARAVYEDWSDAFWAMAERVQSGRVLLFFDEISWMGSKDPTFLAKIKDVWDRRLKQNDRLVFVVCGSASSWIEENLVLNSRRQVHELLRIDPQDIVNENPFYQRKTHRHAGCQIDYLIQSRFGSLYPCEIRFSKEPVGSAVIPEVQAKIAALGRPIGISFRPVLIHVNGVTTDIVDSDYFAAIVDAKDLLRHSKAQASLF